MSSKEEKMESAEEQAAIENENDTSSNKDSDSIDELDELVEQQQERINELEEEIQSIKDNHLRKAAEMENFKKRLQRERESVYQKSRENAIEAFLPVNDDLRRTLEALEQANADKSFVDGVRLVADKFQDVLDRYNVERIDEEGVPFDVNLHDAMLRQPAKEIGRAHV